MEMLVDRVNLRLGIDRGSINYAKARYAIEQDAVNVFKDNKAGQKNWANESKTKIIHILKGKRYGSKVKFEDGSEAKY